MAHIPDDDNYDEFMDASADKWSEPDDTPPPPDLSEEQTDRWGSPIPDGATVNDGDRWGAPALDDNMTPGASSFTPKDKSNRKWWIIAIIAVVVLCLCVCVVVFGLPLIGITLIPTNF